MPKVTLNRKVVENLIGKKLGLEELKDRISMLGTDLEEVNDKEIIVEIFPNRPDMLSEEGFSRALSSFINAKTGLRQYKAKKSDYKVFIESSVKGIRDYTACAIVKKLNLNDEKIKSLIQLQEKLHVTYGRNRKKCAIGIYPMENISLPIYFKALFPEDIHFVPLDSAVVMDGNEILEKHKTGKDYGYLLKGLKKYPIFIDGKNDILSMPPVINSEDTGRVTEKTTEVFIECSGFDFNILKRCLNIIVTSLIDMGGEAYEMTLVYPDKKIKSPDFNSEKLKLDLDYVNKINGLELKKDEIKKLLERMGYGFDGKHALIPCYRADILHEADIATDIAIAYGFENFKEKIPEVSTIAAEDKLETFKRKVSEILIGYGLLETSSYHLSNEKDLNSKMLIQDDFVKLKNVVNPDYDTLRTWLMPGAMKIFSENKHYEYPQKIFEIGRVFSKGESETGVIEKTKLNVSLIGNGEDFTKIKQILEGLFVNLGLNLKVFEIEHNSFIAGRTGVIIVENEDVGFIGEIHPQVLENFNLDNQVSSFELDLGKVFAKLK